MRKEFVQDLKFGVGLGGGLIGLAVSQKILFSISHEMESKPKVSIQVLPPKFSF